MRVSFPRTVLCAFAGLVLAVPVRAVAAEASRKVSLQMDVPRECPGEEAFVRELLARAPSVAIASSSDMALKVTVTRKGGAFAGDVLISDRGEAKFARHIDSKGCADVVSAVALVSAIALEGRGSREDPQNGLGGDASGGHGSAADGSPSPVTGTTTTPAGGSSSDHPTKGDSSESSPKAPSLPGEHVTKGDVGLGGGVRFGGPTEVGGGLHLFAGGHDIRDALFALDVRGRLDVSLPASVEPKSDAGASIQMLWATAGVDACPLGYGRDSARVMLCARADGGIVRAESKGVPASREELRPWADAGLSFRGRLTLGGPFYAAAEAAALAPFIRDRFIFEPSVTVYRSPVVLGQAAVELGASF